MDNHTPYIGVRDHFLSGERFDLYRDELANLKTHPFPAHLGRYYKSEAYISHSSRKKSFTDRLYHGVRKITLRQKTRLIRRYRPQKGTLLDIGAGTGHFVQAATDVGWRARGVEPSAEAREQAQKIGCTLYENYPQEKADVITMWHVLEHIADVDNEIKRLGQALHDNGALIVAVPNYRSYDAQHYGGYWAGYDVPRHLWHFSKKGLVALFKRYGWRCIGMHPMYFDAFYVAILSEQYKKNAFPLLRGMLVGGLSNLYAMITKEYASNIFVFEKT